MITLDTNTIGKSTSQYEGFEFNSMAKVGRQYLGVNEHGVFIIGGPDDNGVPIDATFELPTVDLDNDNIKRLRFMYIGGEFYGDMELVLYVDERDAGPSYDVLYSGVGGQQRITLSIDRTDQGRYWRPIFSNKNGCDFSIDNISVLPVMLHPGHGPV